MTDRTSAKQEIGRKRIAKLLGIAPFRVELMLTSEGVRFEVDGKPASDEQAKVFEDDVQSVLAGFKKFLN